MESLSNAPWAYFVRKAEPKILRLVSSSTSFSELLTIFPGPDISRCQFPDISGYQICSFSENNLTKSLDMTCTFWHFSIHWLLLWPEAGDFKPLHQDRIVAARCKYFFRLSTSWIFNEMRRCDAARNWLCKFLHPIGILWISSVGKFYSLLMECADDIKPKVNKNCIHCTLEKLRIWGRSTKHTGYPHLTNY